jgi:hypothetical protein
MPLDRRNGRGMLKNQEKTTSVFIKLLLNQQAKLLGAHQGNIPSHERPIVLPAP